MFVKPIENSLELKKGFSPKNGGLSEYSNLIFSFIFSKSFGFLRWYPERGHLELSEFFGEFSSECHEILFLGQLLGIFPLIIVVWHCFKVKIEISTKNKKVFFCWKRLLRESFKVTLKEIGKEKKFWNFFHPFEFFHLDTLCYNDRYWKSSTGFTLNDSDDSFAISDDLS